ncbi:MAG: DUF2690 domain-containing protein [Actinobacteria bacterium]|nr:DUF2690 domain-containing protein [Actinomycetota bacterium]
MTTDTDPDPAAGTRQDSVTAFAAALRDLRHEAGNPTLAALSTRTGISKSVLSVAFSGAGLPTERTVLELVRELGGDQNEWRARREALNPRKPPAASDPPGPLADADPAASPGGAADPRRRFTLLQVVLVVLAAVVLSAVVTSLIWGTAQAGASPAGDAGTPQNAAGPFLVPGNGVDPLRTKCKLDRVIAVDEARDDGQVHVQMLYSNACLASWGRVTRYDNASGGNTLSMRIWIENDPNGKRTQVVTGKNSQSVYTPMIVEPDPNVRVCSEATMTADGKTVELGPPICQ